MGANLARELAREGFEVHLLVRPQHKAWRLADIREKFVWHVGHLEARQAVREIVQGARPDWVFHLAAYGAYSWETDANRIAETNLIGMINLLDACVDAGVEAFVNAGSSSEYGLKDHAPTETEPLEPNSTYAVTKAAATMYCRHVATIRRVNAVTLRLYSVYGPFEDAGRLVPRLVVMGMGGRLPPLANPAIARDYVYVSDVYRAFLLAAESNRNRGAVYNLGTGIQTSLAEIVETARRVLNITEMPHWGTMDARGWDTHVWVADNHKIGTELGWTAEYSLEAGLQETWKWFRENPKLVSEHYRATHP